MSPLTIMEPRALSASPAPGAQRCARCSLAQDLAILFPTRYGAAFRVFPKPRHHCDQGAGHALAQGRGGPHTTIGVNSYVAAALLLNPRI